MRFKDLKGNSKIIQTKKKEAKLYIRQKKNSDFQFTRRIVNMAHRLSADAVPFQCTFARTQQNSNIPGYSPFFVYSFAFLCNDYMASIYFFSKRLLFELQFTRAIDPDSPEEKKSYSKTTVKNEMLRSSIFNKAATQTTLLSYIYEVCWNIKIHFQENRQK